MGFLFHYELSKVLSVKPRSPGMRGLFKAWRFLVCLKSICVSHDLDEIAKILGSTCCSFSGKRFSLDLNAIIVILLFAGRRNSVDESHKSSLSSFSMSMFAAKHKDFTISWSCVTLRTSFSFPWLSGQFLLYQKRCLKLRSFSETVLPSCCLITQ